MNSRARITTIIKRDGTSVPYDRERIRIAVLKALTAMGRPDPTLAARTGRNVESALLQTYGPDEPPTVEDIQDIVERF